MKHLILIGGMPWKANDNENNLTRTLRALPAAEIKVAFCSFSRTPTKWDETEQESVEMFNRFGGGKKLVYKNMTSDNFREVSTWADVMYMPGGDPYALMAELIKYLDLAELWNEKIIAGSSAGADALCAQFVYLQKKSFGEGLGWVQVSCVPHWQQYPGYEASDWDFVKSEAIKRYPDLPVLCIPEGQFVEFFVG